MHTTLCPTCHRSTAGIATKADGSEESRCTACGWVGPFCFGHKHDPNNVQCAGGQDPTYWNSGHTRTECSMFEACRQAQAARQNIEIKPPTPTPTNQVPTQPYPVMPPAQPTPPRAAQPPVQQYQYPQQQPTPPQYQPPQQPLQQYQQYQQYQQHQPMQQYQQQQALQQTRPQQVPMQQYQPNQVYYVQPQYAQTPCMVPQNYAQPGAQVPSYLTVPEPYEGSVAKMVALSVMRAGLKGMMHMAANLLDHVQWSGSKPG